MLLDSLKDLVNHTSGLGIEVLKVTGDNGNVDISGVTEDKSLIISGRFNNKISEFEGVFGLRNLDMLDRIIRIYDNSKDIITVSRELRKMHKEIVDDNGVIQRDASGQILTEEIEVNVVDGMNFSRTKPNIKNYYRVVGGNMIPDQYIMAVDIDWDIVFEPSLNGIEMLNQQAGIGLSEVFTVSVEEQDDGTSSLFITMGDGASESVMEFAQNINGVITNNQWRWSVTLVLTLLKLAKSAKCTMSILNKGALKVSIDTGIAQYDYILPAKAQ